MTHDTKEASTLAGELCELNRRRQHLETEIWDDASGMMDGKNAVNAHSSRERKVASGRYRHCRLKLAEQYSKPTIMICLDGDKGKGLVPQLRRL